MAINKLTGTKEKIEDTHALFLCIQLEILNDTRPYDKLDSNNNI